MIVASSEKHKTPDLSPVQCASVTLTLSKWLVEQDLCSTALQLSNMFI